MFTGAYEPTNPFVRNSNKNNWAGTTEHSTNRAANINLSKSNSIYGSSNTVTPLSQKCNFAIRY